MPKGITNATAYKLGYAQAMLGAISDHLAKAKEYDAVADGTVAYHIDAALCRAMEALSIFEDSNEDEET